LPDLIRKEFVTRSFSSNLSLGCGIVVYRVDKIKRLNGYYYRQGLGTETLYNIFRKFQHLHMVDAIT